MLSGDEPLLISIWILSRDGLLGGRYTGLRACYVVGRRGDPEASAPPGSYHSYVVLAVLEQAKELAII